MLALRKEGMGVILDSDLPYLLAIDDNILSTGMKLYHIKVSLTISITFLRNINLIIHLLFNINISTNIDLGCSSATEKFNAIQLVI